MSSEFSRNQHSGNSREYDVNKYNSRDDGETNKVQNHYNSIVEKGLKFRNQSRIVFLRNFNNWIKSMLILEYLDQIKLNKSKSDSIKVLDLCCGKGGDLFKWNKGNITHLVCADIAENSVSDCKRRYDDLKSFSPRLFSAEFIVADLTKTNIKPQFKDPKIQFDMVSCQFAFHYCFESLSQAEMMLQNATECLKPGGYFVGTIPNAYDIVARKQLSGNNWFGNTVFTITFEDDLPEPYPLFGAKYNFHLHESIDCPEYLVHFPTFTRLAKKYGLELVKNRRFQNYYVEKKHTGLNLLRKLTGLETYPAESGTYLLGPRSDYSHAKEYFKEFPGQKLIGTLSQSEWEVATLYSVFAFKKIETADKKIT